MKEFLMILLISMATISVHSQDGEDWRLYRAGQDSSKTKGLTKDTNQVPKTGRVEIIQSERIFKLDSLKKIHPTLPNGYRVQIFFGRRDAAREKKIEFIRQYPETGAYISYLAPNFRLRVGDFRTKLDCEKFKKEIGKSFPGSYIVKDKIELPNLEAQN